MASELETLLAIESHGDLNPVQRTQLEQLKKTQGITGSGGSSGNFGDLVKQAQQMYQESNKPAIESLQAERPEITQKYSQERTRLSGSQASLEKRYAGIIDEIRGNQAKEESRTNIANSAELGRRGISAEGGLFSKTINEALSPITQSYTGMVNSANLSREDMIAQLQSTIAELVSQETGALRSNSNAQANLTSSAGASGVQSGLQMYSLQQQAQENALNRALSQQTLDESTRQSGITNALAQQKFLEEQRQYEKTYNKPKAASTASPTKLNTQTVTDAFGNTKVISIDPYTGATNVVYDNTPAQTTTSSSPGIIDRLRGFFNL